MAALVDGDVPEPPVQLLLPLLPPHLHELLPGQDAGACGLARVLHNGLQAPELVLEVWMSSDGSSDEVKYSRIFKKIFGCSVELG